MPQLGVPGGGEALVESQSNQRETAPTTSPIHQINDIAEMKSNLLLLLLNVSWSSSFVLTGVPRVVQQPAIRLRTVNAAAVAGPAVGTIARPIISATATASSILLRRPWIAGVAVVAVAVTAISEVRRRNHELECMQAIEIDSCEVSWGPLEVFTVAASSAIYEGAAATVSGALSLFRGKSETTPAE